MHRRHTAPDRWMVFILEQEPCSATRRENTAFPTSEDNTCPEIYVGICLQVSNLFVPPLKK